MALYASKLGNLIEAVNILGSLFYGTILGIFVVAFYFKKINGKATFKAAIITEIIVFTFWFTDVMAFLWLNVAGCLTLVLIAWLFERVMPEKVIPVAETNS
jgi:Na+/proline symporter